MANETDTKAVTAALEAPVPFRTNLGTIALHAAERHVERLAPEHGATSRSRSLRSLAFVDRLVSPWVEAAQRSASLRVFGEYQQHGWGERSVAPATWVFPRPWYQDELDWMAAARQVAQMSPGREAITTRGTYVQASPTSAPAPMALPMELVAPSLSIATASTLAVAPEAGVSGVAPIRTAPFGAGPAAYTVAGVPSTAVATRPLAAWSPLVPFAAAQAAQIFAGAIGQAMETGLSTADRSPILGALAFVAPSDVGARVEAERAFAERAELAERAQLAGTGEPTVARAPVATPSASPISSSVQAQLATVLQQIEAIRAQAAAPAQASAPAPAVRVPDEIGAPRVETAVAAEQAQARAAEQARVVEQAQAQAQAVDQARVAEQVRAVEQGRAGQVAEQARAEQIAEQTRAVEQTRAEQVAEHVRAVEQARTAEQVRAVEQARAAEQAQAQARARSADAQHEAPIVAPTATLPSAAALDGISSAAAAEIASRVDAPSFAPAALASMSPAAIASIARAVASSPAAASALRAIELLTRAAASGVAPSPIGGPRVAMPAGLGGLVAAVDTAGAMQRPMTAAVPAYAAAAHVTAPYAAAAAFAVAGAADDARPVSSAFAPVWAMPAASGGALGAIASERPAGVDHVAWADRWLARFAGASTQSLAALDAVTAPVSFEGSPLAARAYAAPEAIYVAPVQPARFDGADADDARAATVPGARAPFAAPTAYAPSPTAAASRAAAAPRFDDAQSVPDDVFAAILAPQAAPARPAPRAAAQAASASASAATAPVAALVNAPSIPLVDRIAYAVPAAPGAGLLAALASSPIAPALTSLLALPSAPSFDARSLFTDGLVASYLEGIIAPAARFAVGTPSIGTGGGATGGTVGGISGGGVAWSTATESFASPEAAIAASFARLAALAPTAAYVAPFAPDAPAGDAALRGGVRTAQGDELATAATPSGAPTATAPAISTAATAPVAPTATPATAPTAVLGAIPSTATPFTAAAAAATSGAPSTPGAVPATSAARADMGIGAEPTRIAAVARAAELRSELIAVRSELLASAASAAAVRADLATVTPSTIAATAAPAGLDAPLATPSRAAWTGAPGMTGALAQSWAIAQEQSSADLSFDFVAPEIVLAARVYGFGPAEAAQAQRLALAGPSGLSAMAAALDLTFLRAVQAGTDAQLSIRESAARAAGERAAYARDPFTGLPVAAPAASAETAAPSFALAAPAADAVVPSTAEAGAAIAAPAVSTGFDVATAPSAGVAPLAAPSAGVAPASFAPTDFAPITAFPSAFAPGERSQLFGVEKRLPRGAFLWPAATVGAVGLNALTPEGLATLPVAALELLAASAVADLGQWVVAREIFEAAGADAGFEPGSTAARTWTSARAAAFAATAGSAAASLGAPATGLGTLGAPLPVVAGAASAATSSAAAIAGVPGLAPGASDETVASAVAAVAMPTSASARRARFESVYLALSRSTDGRSLSPSARAARALAILSRSDDGAGRGTPIERAAAAWQMIPLVLSNDAPASGAFAASTDRGDGAELGMLAADVRPGLQPLASRAGDALGSFVAPSRDELETGDRSYGGERGTSRAAASAPETTYVETVAPSDASAERASRRASRSSAGVPFARHGGGELEIPSWFESAAKKIMGAQSPGSDMTIAELTLVTAAPSRSIAADVRGQSASSAPSSPSGAGGRGQAKGEKPDIDKIAAEVYAEILRIIDAARERNGEPYL